MQKKRALFFDRDDCLIVNKHYLSDPAGIEYYPDTFSALKRLQNDFFFFIVTNQSGIGRGLFTEEDMHAVHRKLLADFTSHSISIEAIQFCPHAPSDQCDCRKPSAKLVKEILVQYQIEASNCYFIGDKASDAQCGHNAGMPGLIVHNHLEDYPSFPNLEAVADYILKN